MNPGRSLAMVTALACLTPACSDPVRDRLLDSLGGERQGVPAGPLHRPGEPCLACHDGTAAEARYSVAGTVYLYAGDDRPAPRVDVELIDSVGARFSARTNCAGNFFVAPEEFDPAFPLWTSVSFGLAKDGGTASGGSSKIDMQSRIGRDGSCASCHVNAPSRSATDRVHLYTTPVDPADEPGCP
jgi:hypothetical protein